MTSICVTFLLILLFFLSGRIFEAIKRLLALFLDIGLKILNLFGIHINRKETRLRTSHEFKATFKDIKIVKRSRQNNKIKPSVNLIALIILILSIGSVIYNVTSGGVISNFLFKYNPFPSLITDQVNMNTTFTALMFSIISFSISKLISQWKETVQFRKTKREMKLRGRVLEKMSSKDLLDAAKQKDEYGFNKLSKQDEE